MEEFVGSRAVRAGRSGALKIVAGVARATRPDETGPAASAVHITDARLAEIAVLLLRSRQRLSKYFEPSVFAAPAWDMLLELFVARAQNRRTPTMDLCAAVRVPAPTGLRWIQRLSEQRLVRRFKVPRDNRLVLVEITPRGMRLMRQYIFEGMVQSDLPVPG